MNKQEKLFENVVENWISWEQSADSSDALRNSLNTLHEYVDPSNEKEWHALEYNGQTMLISHVIKELCATLQSTRLKEEFGRYRKERRHWLGYVTHHKEVI